MNFLSFVLRSNFWIKDFFKGGCIHSHYSDIRNFEEGNERAQLQRKQLLLNLLHHAVQHTTFYRGISALELKAFPVVNKSILQAHFEEIMVPEIHNVWQKKGKYVVQKTSGSTGTPFATPQDSRKRMRRLAELKYFGNSVGFKSHDKLVQLRIWTKWQSKSKKQSFWENIVPFDISNLGDENLKLLCDTIHQAQAKCLRGYASSFDVLAQYVGSHDVKLPSVKIIIAGSETLFDSTRELVKKNIGCNIISQYANEENGILAQERLGDTEHRFYLNEASYYFEVLKLDSDEPAEYGELGRLVITDLFNYAFPIIRYDNGDNCVMELDAVTNRPYIAKLVGRRLDMIYNTRNEPIFPMTLARILKNYDDIAQWQFIQETPVEYKLKLAIKGGGELRGLLSDEIFKQLAALLGSDAGIGFEYVDDIPVLNSGKRKAVVNRCTNFHL